MPMPTDAWPAAHDDVAVVELDRDVLEATGPDAASFLHGQLSQAIEPMAVGESRWSFLLQPQGKVEAIVRLTRTGPERFVLDTDAGYGPKVIDSLSRFKLRTRIELETLPWRVVGLRGPGAAAVGAAAELDVAATGGRDLLGPEPSVPADLPRLTPGEAEALRILAHEPRLGIDVDESTIPQETGIADALVDFAKGCYRGQELVERIHSRGGVRRRLQVLDTAGPVTPGDPVTADGADIGRVTSAAAWPGREPHWAAMALVRTDAPLVSVTIAGHPATLCED
jgi:tRNA-modifying protein YgfZ